MKIIFLNPTAFLGGAEMCLLDLLTTLGPGVTPKVILMDDGPLKQAVETLGVPCDVLPLPDRLAGLGDAGIGLNTGRKSRLRLAVNAPGAAVAGLGYLRLLRRRLREEAPDLVQTNGMKAHVLGAWAAPKGVPVVWHLHDYLSGRAVMGRLLRGSLRESLKVVAVSRSVAIDAAKVLGRRVPVVPILNAVDLERFSPGPGDGPRLDAEAGLTPAPEGTVRVGLVATYARWKGHEVFLEAIAKVPRDRPSRFYIVGGPLYRASGSQWSAEELRSHAEKRGVGDRVGFVRHKADPESIYRALDVVVHASTRPEPFGRVIVEAMACGKAVAAVSVGGASELFTDGVSAIACPPGDAVGLANTLTRLIDEPDLRTRLGEAGRREAVERFDRARLKEEWERVYRR